MSIEEALQAYLIGNAGVAALFGDRIYPNVIPQTSPLPAAAFQTVTTTGDDTHDGPSGWTEITLQITVDGAAYLATKAAVRAIYLALRGYSGTLSGVKIYYISRENLIDGYNEGSKSTTIRQDFKVQYLEV